MTGFRSPSGSSMASRSPIRVQSRGRLFGKGHLWPPGTARFARPLPPKRCGLPRLILLGPGQSDFGRIYFPTGKDALGPMHWHVGAKIADKNARPLARGDLALNERIFAKRCRNLDFRLGRVK